MAEASVQIDVLGSLEIRRTGARVELRGSRPRAALAALLVHAPYPVSTDGLAAAIWEKELPARPRGAVQTVVSRLRSVLGGEVVRHDPVGYHLELPAGAVDAERFEALCRQAGELPTSRAAAMLDSALGLWRGPAYAEFADREFAVVEAVRLEERRMKAMEDRAGLALEFDDADTAVAVLQGVVAEQPLRERAHGLLMTALYRAGRTTEALDQYQALRRSLAEELGLYPSPALRELQVQILDHAVPESPAARPPPRRVPPAWEPATDIFIGREDDTAALLRAVDTHRLVCVTGPGGVGKSRLVAETLPELTRRLDRPAAVVEFEDTLPAQVDEKVAASLGLGVTTEPRAGVLEYLAASSLILVLDACERALGRIRALVREILRAAPRVNLLVTSRHRLELGAEQVLPLAPLAPPDSADEPDRAVLAPAMRLFIERLRRGRPGTDLGPALIRDAGELCRRLDGLPLALELAATQAVTLGVHTVLTGFGERLHLEGRPEQPLRSIVARSHDLLEEADRALLGRLSAFTGSFALEDAVQVAPGGQAATGLSRLVAASLVDSVENGPEERFRLLGIIRAYAAGHTDDGTRQAYWRWAAESTGRWAREATGPDAARALRRLDLASADLTAATEQALAAGRLDLAARIVGNAGQCVHWIPGVPLAEVTLAVGDHPGLSGVTGEAFARGAAAIAAVERGELDRAERLGRLARETATTPAERFLAAVALGIAAVYAGNWETAVRRWRRVLAIDGLPAAHLADAHSVLALLLAAAGHPRGLGRHAAEHATSARRAAERSGAPPRVAFALYASGEVLLVTDRAAAIDVLREAAGMADSANAVQVAGVARVALLSALTRTGRTTEAVDLSLTLLELQQRRSYWAQLWNTMRILAELFVAAGRLDTAELILAAAEASESAPGLAGADIERHRLLRRRIHEGLGADKANRIAAVARLLPRTEILRRTRDAAEALSSREPDRSPDAR